MAVAASAPLLAGRSFAVGTLSISVGGTSALVDHSTSSRTLSFRDLDLGEALFRTADDALYRAKAMGRNRAWVTDGSIPKGLSSFR